jgi:hypothetical protein
MHACVHVGTRVRGHVHVPLLIHQAARMRHIVTSLVILLAPPKFSTLSHKRCDFRKEAIEHKIYVLILSTTFL